MRAPAPASAPTSAPVSKTVSRQHSSITGAAAGRLKQQVAEAQAETGSAVLAAVKSAGNVAAVDTAAPKIKRGGFMVRHGAMLPDAGKVCKGLTVGPVHHILAVYILEVKHWALLRLHQSLCQWSLHGSACAGTGLQQC